MKRLEIIANRSVQADIVEGLEGAVAGFYYTLVPMVHGRGRQERRLGTATWPEENFLLISYLDDEAAEAVASVITRIKSVFPTEGIKLFILGEPPRSPGNPAKEQP